MNIGFFLGFIAILSIFASGKVLSQVRGARLYTVTTADCLLFMSFILFFTSLTFLPSFLLSPPPAEVLLYCIPYALLTLLFQVSYTVALAKGSAALTTLIASLAMLIPLLLATLFLNESFGVFRIVGLVLTLTTLFLNTDFRHKSEQVPKKKKTSSVWLVAIIFTFFSNGLSAYVQKLFSISEYGTNPSSFGFFAYSFSALVGFLTLLLLRLFQRNGETAHFSRGLFLSALRTGIILGIFQWFYMFANRRFEVTLLAPVYNGAQIVVLTLISVFLLKEKITKRRTLAIIFGVVAIVFFSIS